MLALSVASPAYGLLAVAALAPLGHLLGVAFGMGIFRLAEALVLAFITGWLVRAPTDRRGPRVPAALGWLFAISVVASIAGLAWQRIDVAEAVTHHPAAELACGPKP